MPSHATFCRLKFFSILPAEDRYWRQNYQGCCLSSPVSSTEWCTPGPKSLLNSSERRMMILIDDPYWPKRARKRCNVIEVIHYRNVSNYLAFQQRIFIPPDFFRDARRQFHDVEIAHIHDLRSFLSVGAHSALQSLRVPFVLSPHGGLQYLGKRSAKF